VRLVQKSLRETDANWTRETQKNLLESLGLNCYRGRKRARRRNEAPLTQEFSLRFCCSLLARSKVSACQHTALHCTAPQLVLRTNTERHLGRPQARSLARLPLSFGPSVSPPLFSTKMRQDRRPQASSITRSPPGLGWPLEAPTSPAGPLLPPLSLWCPGAPVSRRQGAQTAPGQLPATRTRGR